MVLPSLATATPKSDPPPPPWPTGQPTPTATPRRCPAAPRAAVPVALLPWPSLLPSPTGQRAAAAVVLFAFCPATPWVLLGDSPLDGFGNSSPRGQACLLGRCAPGSRCLVAHWPAAAPCQQESSSSCLQPSPIALKHEREYKPRWLVASEQMARCSQERPPGKLPRCRSKREQPHDRQYHRTSVMLVHWTIVASTALRPYRRTEPKSRRRCNGASTGTGNSFK